MTTIKQLPTIEETLKKLGFIAQDPVMDEVKKLIAVAAISPVEVLVQGDTGTGKELVVKAIIEQCPMRDQYTAVNCSVFDGSEIIESTLFGHVKGAFTGATVDKMGFFEEASHGFLFLDEIHNMPLNQQNKFLRALQERQGSRMGSAKLIDYDFRLICATNRDLLFDVEQGLFKEDLYHRINCIKINIPSLRKRPGDILAIATHILYMEAKRFDQESGQANLINLFFTKPIDSYLFSTVSSNKLPFTEPTINAFMAYTWPGNVRELNNEIRRILANRQLEAISVDNKRKTNKIRLDECSSTIRNFNSTLYNTMLVGLSDDLLSSEISDDALRQDIKNWTEILAENAHDLWAKQRIGEGWVVGKCRDDVKKEHPDLIPYQWLAESEKEYDRHMALGTIKKLLELGVRFEGMPQIKDNFELYGTELKKAMVLFESEMIKKALDKYNGHQGEAAKFLKITRESLSSKVNDKNNKVRIKEYAKYRKKRLCHR